MTRSKRHEFKKPTKRDALKRSNGKCEAIGEVYGLAPGQRCNAPLSRGVQFDHWPLPATDFGSDTLDNCVAVCIQCHSYKTRTYDTPMQAKGKRVSDKRLKGELIDPNKTYKVAGWAPVSEEAKNSGEPIWDVVATYLRDIKTVKPVELNLPTLKGVGKNPGMA